MNDQGISTTSCLEMMDPQNKVKEVECKLCFVFHPRWALHLTNRRIFAFVFSVVGIIQGMGFIYTIATITSLENHFQLPSKIIGTIMSVGEVTVIITGLATGLLLSVKTHRPRALGTSLAIMGVGCHLFALPYYIYGSPTPFNATQSRYDYNNNISLCNDNSTFLFNRDEKDCRPALEAPRVSVGLMTALLLIAYIICQIGTTAFLIIGTPFLDDNVQNKNSAMYIAITSSVRTLGPILGTLLASLCLTIYVDPLSPPSWFDAHDTRWVGAWWIGYVVMGSLLIICGFAVAQYPRRLPSNSITPAVKMEEEEMKRQDNGEKQEKTKILNISSLKEMRGKMRRILVNPILWMRVLSATFTVFGEEGYLLYLPKYLEHEFKLTSSQAGMWMGMAFIAPQAFGYLVFGFIIQRFRVTARQLAVIVIFSKLTEAIVTISLIFFRCEKSHLLGGGNNYPICNGVTCDCSSAVMAPVCGSDGFSYFSACHAGCSDTNRTFNHFALLNCACVAGDGKAVSDGCHQDCSEKYIYLSVVAISKFFLSVEVIAIILFTLRVARILGKRRGQTSDVTAFMGCFALIPCPIIFSAVVDSTCSVWSEQCDRKGACDVYDMDKLRLILHISPVVCLFFGVIFDILFWRLSKDKLSLITDEEEIKGDVK